MNYRISLKFLIKPIGCINYYLPLKMGEKSFPEKSLFLNVTEEAEIVRILQVEYEKEKQVSDFFSFFPYKMRRETGNAKQSSPSLLFQCKECRSFLKWTLNNNKLEIKTFKNLHCHVGGKKFERAMLEEVRTLPEGVNYEQLIPQLSRKYNFTPSNCVRILNKLKSKDKEELKEMSQSQNSFFFTHPSFSETSLPHLVIASTEKMKKYFLECGYAMKISFIRNFSIKNTNSSALNNDQASVSIALMVGCDPNRNPLLFGFAILAEENQNLFQLMLDKFFAFMGKNCRIVYSDSSELERAIKSIQSAEEHPVFLEDCEKLLDQMQLTNREYQIYEHLLEAPSHFLYDHYLARLKGQSGQNGEKVRKIQALIKRASIVNSPKCFGMLNLWKFKGDRSPICSVRKKLISEENSTMQKTIKNLLHLAKYININSHRRKMEVYRSSSPEYFHEKGINFVQNLLDKKVFKLLLKNINYSLKLSVEAKEEDEAVVCERNKKVKVVRMENGRWRCECGYFEKTYLPCHHEIRVCENLREQVGGFWMGKRESD